MADRKRFKPTKDKHDGKDSKGRFTSGHKPYSTPGRPKAAAGFRESCREYLQMEGGFEKLVAIANNDKHKHQLDALELVCAYAYGRPTSSLEVKDLSAPKIEIIYENKPKMLEVNPKNGSLIYGSKVNEIQRICSICVRECRRSPDRSPPHPTHGAAFKSQYRGGKRAFKRRLPACGFVALGRAVALPMLTRGLRSGPSPRRRLRKTPILGLAVPNPGPRTRVLWAVEPRNAFALPRTREHQARGFLSTT
jgi:hypothetical protein